MPQPDTVRCVIVFVPHYLADQVNQWIGEQVHKNAAAAFHARGITCESPPRPKARRPGSKKTTHSGSKKVEPKAKEPVKTRQWFPKAPAPALTSDTAKVVRDEIAPKSRRKRSPSYYRCQEKRRARRLEKIKEQIKEKTAEVIETTPVVKAAVVPSCEIEEIVEIPDAQVVQSASASPSSQTGSSACATCYALSEWYAFRRDQLLKALERGDHYLSVDFEERLRPEIKSLLVEYQHKINELRTLKLNDHTNAYVGLAGAISGSAINAAAQVLGQKSDESLGSKILKSGVRSALRSVPVVGGIASSLV